MSSALSVSRRKMSLSQRLPSLDTIPTMARPVLNRLPTLNVDHFPDITSMMYGFFTPANQKAALLTPRLELPNPGEITCWIVDTRTLWPGSAVDSNIWTAVGAAEAMALLPLAEQHAISSKMFLLDAKMSLASALLKRLYVAQTLDLAWKDVGLSRKGDLKNGKPCAVDPIGRPIEGIDFNVSHQNGLVTLIGWNGMRRHRYSPSGAIQGFISPGANFEPEVMVGVDIVCVNERDDYRTIEAEGLDGWVDIYDFVFSDEERWSMKYDVDYVTLLDGTIIPGAELGRHDRCISRNKPIQLRTSAGKLVKFNSDQLIDAKLRRFYTYFCYKEAYIKLAGEALLAPWLKQLEFFNVRSPKPGVPARCSTLGQWGEVVDDVEVHMNGTEVLDVKMNIQAFEEHFMIGTAIQGAVAPLSVPPFQKLDLRTDVLNWAHKHISVSPSEFR